MEIPKHIKYGHLYSCITLLLVMVWIVAISCGWYGVMCLVGALALVSAVEAFHYYNLTVEENVRYCRTGLMPEISEPVKISPTHIVFDGCVIPIHGPDVKKSTQIENTGERIIIFDD